MDHTAHHLMNTVTFDFSLWESYMWTTGGLIEHVNIIHRLMIWQFTSAGTLQITPNSDLSKNTVVIHKNEYGTDVKIIPTSNARIMMGVHQALR
eukprot:1328983-Ditylum_brightwellii.AAC.1